MRNNKTNTNGFVPPVQLVKARMMGQLKSVSPFNCWVDFDEPFGMVLTEEQYELIKKCTYNPETNRYFNPEVKIYYYNKYTKGDIPKTYIVLYSKGNFAKQIGSFEDPAYIGDVPEFEEPTETLLKIQTLKESISNYEIPYACPLTEIQKTLKKSKKWEKNN